MKSNFLLTLTIVFFFIESCNAQPGQQSFETVIFSDVAHYWEAYDSIQTTNDYSEQLRFINELYIRRGTQGLKDFIKVRNYTDTLWVDNIRSYPEFWKVIRNNMKSIELQADSITKGIQQLRELYPPLRPATIYFCIGGLNTGGTAHGSNVLIGSEIAFGDSTVPTYEFSTKWYENMFRTNKIAEIPQLNIHEYIHTQQSDNKLNWVLAFSVREGASVLVSNLLKKGSPAPVSNSYYNLHKNVLISDFYRDAFTPYYQKWLYNGSTYPDHPDLGYLIGYEICRQYYLQHEDKQKAVQEIIEIDYTSGDALVEFVNRSRFFPDRLNADSLWKLYQSKQPVIKKITGPQSGVAPTSLSMIKIHFSKPMQEEFSIDNPSTPHAVMPLDAYIGWENDDSTIVFELKKLEPETLYEFIITNTKFESKDGYYFRFPRIPVRFRTEK